MYLVAVLEWYSHFVISWELDQTSEQPFVLRAVGSAINLAKLDIWNSDPASHFTSPKYTWKLLEANVRISMDGKGLAMDNILTLTPVYRSYVISQGQLLYGQSILM